jgi:hypothetical protein
MHTERKDRLIVGLSPRTRFKIVALVEVEHAGSPVPLPGHTGIGAPSGKVVDCAFLIGLGMPTRLVKASVSLAAALQGTPFSRNGVPCELGQGIAGRMHQSPARPRRLHRRGLTMRRVGCARAIAQWLADETIMPLNPRFLHSKPATVRFNIDLGERPS